MLDAALTQARNYAMLSAIENSAAQWDGGIFFLLHKVKSIRTITFLFVPADSTN